MVNFVKNGYNSLARQRVRVDYRVLRRKLDKRHGGVRRRGRPRMRWVEDGEKRLGIRD